jgi:hypothetical protein
VYILIKNSFLSAILYIYLNADFEPFNSHLMKQFSKFAAIGCLTITALTAKAQFVVDGRATATEIGTGMGKYQLAATYTGSHLEADRGLQALYVGYTATTLNIMLVGSAESATTTPSGGYRSLMIYLNTPARPGAAAGTALPGGSDPQSPFKHHPTMDNPTDYGFRVSVGPTSATANDVYFSRVSYVTGTAVTPGTDTFIAAGTKAGGQVVAPTTLDLAGSKFAYSNTATLTANTTNSGFELEIPLSALGTTTVPITTGTNLEMVAAYTDGDGIFFSDLLPSISGRTTTLGSDPNFSTIPGNQFLTVQLGTGVGGRISQPGLGLGHHCLHRAGGPAAGFAGCIQCPGPARACPGQHRTGRQPAVCPGQPTRRCLPRQAPNRQPAHQSSGGGRVAPSALK